MELNIKVCTDDSCKIIIQDTTEIGGSGYLPESSSVTVKYRFKYSDTVSIDVLQHNKTQAPEMQIPIYTKHSEVPTPITLPISFDGWFSAYHIVLPSKEWFDREKEKQEGSALPLYDAVYFSDGESIFKYVEDQIQQVQLEEVILRNEDGSTISRTYESYVSICLLKKCYISLCQKLFNNRGFSGCYNKDITTNETMYKRDLVWMTINVIKYLTEFNQLAEVQRLIERIGGCNGLCQSEYKQFTSRGCGCS